MLNQMLVNEKNIISELNVEIYKYFFVHVDPPTYEEAMQFERS